MQHLAVGLLELVARLDHRVEGGAQLRIRLRQALRQRHPLHQPLPQCRLRLALPTRRRATARRCRHELAPRGRCRMAGRAAAAQRATRAARYARLPSLLSRTCRWTAERDDCRAIAGEGGGGEGGRHVGAGEG